jgi:hypothetical protein
MVHALEETARIDPDMDNQALVMEIVGPAGAGKTTIARELARGSKNIILASAPSVRSPFNAPYYVSHCIRLVPVFLRLPRKRGRSLSRREIAWLAILSGWYQVLQREKLRRCGVILLDQGPVFLLAELHRMGPDVLRDPRLEEWWQRVYCGWATTLDTIVWVDAEDAELIDRIRNRRKSHLMKERPEAQTVEFLERYRAAYEQVLSSLAANSPSPRVLRYDTSRERSQQIVDRLLLESGLIAREPVLMNLES